MNWEVFETTALQFWPHLVAALSLTIAIVASAHVVMYKRDSRAAIGWAGIIWLVPLFGTALYVVLGINRVQRKAIQLRGPFSKYSAAARHEVCTSNQLLTALGREADNLVSLEHLVSAISPRKALTGNQITPLVNGDEAYPQMLAAIDGAEKSVTLCSYIFNHDRVGTMFVEALGRAVSRGVQVHVLIDDIGARYHWPAVDRALKKVHVSTARFMPTLVKGWFAYANLRSHRKLLVVDGQVGFTGGLNIQEGHMLSLHPAKPIHDMHFRLAGPVVSHLQETFVDDWNFCTGELLEGEAFFPPIAPAGQVVARGISAGPDRDFDKVRVTILGALSVAHQSVCIVTPYFLPDDALINALNVAALRGVDIDIYLPSHNNLALVQWASNAQMWQILENGCRVWSSPPPFDHTKMLVVDRAWTLFGSANWDPRSLRLNFEFDVECYDRQLAESLDHMLRQRRQGARPITLADMDERSLPVRLRDGLARLLSPYL